MCTGAEVVPLVLAAGSAKVNYDAQQKEKRVREEAAAYASRQNLQEQGQATEAAAVAANQYSPGSIQDLLNKSREERQGATDIAVAPGLDEDYGGSAPDAFKKDISRKIIETVAEGKEQSKRTANLNSISDALFSNRLGNIDASRDIGMNVGNIYGNQNVAGLEMELSPLAGDDLRTVSDLFGAAGTFANVYGATGTKKKPFEQPWTPNQNTPVIPNSAWLPVR